MERFLNNMESKYREKLYRQIIAESNPSQHHEELLEFLVYIDDISTICNFDSVLEVGVHMGGTYRVWDRALNPGILAGIDNHLQPAEKLIEEFSTTVNRGLFVPNDSTDPFTRDAIKEWFEVWGKDRRLLDFIFIDGDHRYGGVKKDFELYSPLCRHRAIIAFHDINVPVSEEVGVRTFWDEISQHYGNFEISHPGGTGIGVLLYERETNSEPDNSLS